MPPPRWLVLGTVSNRAAEPTTTRDGETAPPPASRDPMPGTSAIRRSARWTSTNRFVDAGAVTRTQKAIERAIDLNGVAVEANLASFRWEVPRTLSGASHGRVARSRRGAWPCRRASATPRSMRYRPRAEGLGPSQVCSIVYRPMSTNKPVIFRRFELRVLKGTRGTTRRIIELHDCQIINNPEGGEISCGWRSGAAAHPDRRRPPGAGGGARGGRRSRSRPSIPRTAR